MKLQYIPVIVPEVGRATSNNNGGARENSSLIIEYEVSPGNEDPTASHVTYVFNKILGIDCGTSSRA